MIVKELEGKVQQLSQQFHDKVTTIDEKVTTFGKQNNDLQKLMKHLSAIEPVAKRKTTNY